MLLCSSSLIQMQGPVHFLANLNEILLRCEVKTNNCDPPFISGILLGLKLRFVHSQF